MVRGRRLWSAAGVVAFFVLIPVALLLAQRPAASASTALTLFTDAVSIARGTDAFTLAHDGDVVHAGDRLRTDHAGHALITFFDGSTLEIEPATVIQVDGASTDPNGSIAIQLTQTIGRSWASVQKLTRADSKFDIRTPAATAAVRGTAFLTEVLADGTTRVETSEGVVEVSAQGQSVLVRRGQATSVRPNSPPTAPAPARTPTHVVQFGMHSPAYLTVVDPIGRACGLMASGAMVRQIPGCAATPAGTEPQLIDVPEALAGTYQLVIAPIGEGGAFTLTATGVEGAGAIAFDRALAGVARKGVTLGSTLAVQVSADGFLAAGDLEPLVTLSVVPVRAITPAGSVPPPTPSGAPVVAAATSTAPLTSPAQTQSPAPTMSPAPTTSSPFAQSSPPASAATISPSPPISRTPSPSQTSRPESTQTVVVTSPPSAAAAPTQSATPAPGVAATPTPTPTPPTSDGTAPPGPTATPRPTRVLPRGASVCSVMSDERCRFAESSNSVSRDANGSETNATSVPRATPQPTRALPRGVSLCSVISDARCRFADLGD